MSGIGEREIYTYPKNWSDGELDRIVVEFVGEGQFSLERIRSHMERRTKLPLFTLDLSINRVTETVGKLGRPFDPVKKLRPEAKKSFIILQQETELEK